MKISCPFCFNKLPILTYTKARSKSSFGGATNLCSCEKEFCITFKRNKSIKWEMISLTVDGLIYIIYNQNIHVTICSYEKTCSADDVNKHITFNKMPEISSTTLLDLVKKFDKFKNFS